MLIRHNQIFCPAFIGGPMKTANHFPFFWLDLFSKSFFKRPMGWLEIIPLLNEFVFWWKSGVLFLEGEKCFFGIKKKGHKISILEFGDQSTGSDHKPEVIKDRKWHYVDHIIEQNRKIEVRSKICLEQNEWQIYDRCVYDNDVIMT